jgi:hypothetical protein
MTCNASNNVYPGQLCVSNNIVLFVIATKIPETPTLQTNLYVTSLKLSNCLNDEKYVSISTDGFTNTSWFNVFDVQRQK